MMKKLQFRVDQNTGAAASEARERAIVGSSSQIHTESDVTPCAGQLFWGLHIPLQNPYLTRLVYIPNIHPIII